MKKEIEKLCQQIAQAIIDEDRTYRLNLLYQKAREMRKSSTDNLTSTVGFLLELAVDEKLSR